MKNILLVACGSYNPITNMHLRLFELARDALQKCQPCRVAGVISPVHDGYAKKDLASSVDRIEMVRLALKTSDWIKVDTWEADQDKWLETVNVLRHFKEVAASYFVNSTDRIENHDRNANNVDNRNDDDDDIQILLLCGADLLNSFTIPNVWSEEHMEIILRDFGMVVCTREGYNLNELVCRSNWIKKYAKNIRPVTEWVTNEISSTKIREALARGESVKYLIQDGVIEYIKKNQIYRKIPNRKD